MNESQQGGERGRQDIYGPTPSPENVEGVLEDELAVEAIIAHCLHRGEPPVPQAVKQRAVSRPILSAVLNSNQIKFGGPEMGFFRDVYHDVEALRTKSSGSTTRVSEEAAAPTPPQQRYHRA